MTGWVALFAWAGLVTRPWDFLVTALFGGVAMALVGSLLRTVSLPAYVVPLVQVLVGALSLNLVVAHAQSFLGVVPTISSAREVVYSIGNGAASLNTYVSPVAANQHDTRAMLMACGLAVLWSVDVLAFTLRRPSLVALPLLVTLSIPVSILQSSLALPVFIGTALLFLRLLATEHLDRFRTWGTGSTKADQPALNVLWQVSLVAVVVALLTAPLVPVADLLSRQPGDGNGTSGSNLQLSAVNPFVRLRRDLVEKTHTPLVYARTDALSTAYLRTTVLDEFTNVDWRPSPRNLPTANTANGAFPNAPGLLPGSGGRTDTWSLQLAPYFTTTWLPLPYPILDLHVRGGWRYDSRTLDVALTGRSAPPALSYTATAFSPTIAAQTLEEAVEAPRKVLKPMTEVPRDLPEVIKTRAREVTKGARTDFAKAVALQNWFREGGGFRYSLQRRAGSGMDLLAAFVTDDRVGYCEQFAAAMAAMGRALGIPSRVVVGFLDGTTQSDGRILYTSDERHAWPEMYFTGVGWVRFEPTPSARTGPSPAYTRQVGTAPTPTQAPSAAATPRSSPEAAAAAAEKAK
jgi:transglutaminase-like putative cysteine protease